MQTPNSERRYVHCGKCGALNECHSPKCFLCNMQFQLNMHGVIRLCKNNCPRGTSPAGKRCWTCQQKAVERAARDRARPHCSCGQIVPMDLEAHGVTKCRRHYEHQLEWERQEAEAATIEQQFNHVVRLQVRELLGDMYSWRDH